jgi:hypothetical protein
VTIFVPSTWSLKSHYEDVRTETYRSRDFLIEKHPDDGTNPIYTLLLNGCGEHGEFVHLSDQFMLDDSIASEYGPRGKVSNEALFFFTILIPRLRKSHSLPPQALAIDRLHRVPRRDV